MQDNGIKKKWSEDCALTQQEVDWQFISRKARWQYNITWDDSLEDKSGIWRWCDKEQLHFVLTLVGKDNWAV